jgi:hypothetical protein
MKGFSISSCLSARAILLVAGAKRSQSTNIKTRVKAGKLAVNLSIRAKFRLNGLQSTFNWGQMEQPKQHSAAVKWLILMERAMGIEPTSEAWEASILPLYDARSAPPILTKFMRVKQSCRVENENTVQASCHDPLLGLRACV